MAYAPLIVTFPGGIGNPVGEHIATSGGRRRQNTRRRRNTRKTRRNTRRMGCGLMRKNRRRRNTRRA